MRFLIGDHTRSLNNCCDFSEILHLLNLIPSDYPCVSIISVLQ